MTIAAGGPAGPVGVSGATTVVPRRGLPPGHYDLVGLMRSEWTKLRTVRSTMWTLGITVVVGIGISALATALTRSHWATMPLPTRAGFDPTQVSLTALLFCQLATGILGVLVMSAEYGTGTVRATFSAAPRRPAVLLAKIAVFGAVALVVSEVTAFVSFFVGQAMLTAPAPHATLGTPGALRAVVGTGLYLCVISLFALGLATILRHTAGAISAFVGVLLVLPIIIQALPNSIGRGAMRFMPLQIGGVMMNPHVAGPNDFSAWTGFFVLCVYAVAALVIGAVLLERRDV
ncbi:MAG: ABC transporter permease [Acidimicrobiales bacterium]